MLLLATSDASDRPDASGPEAAPEPASEEEQPESPERAPATEPRETEPEIAPHEPTPSEPQEPEIEPPDKPEITPPGSPETEPPNAPEIAPPEASEPPDSPETTPPGSPEIEPPAPPEIEPPASGRAPTPASEPPPEPEAERRSPLQRAVLAFLIIAAAALIGYVLSRPGGRDAGADALARTVEAAGQLRLVLETDTPAEARQFVRDEFGWRVGVPVFEVIPLRGVAIAQTAPAVEVPVFLYADAEGRNVAVFAYSYALLDQVPDRLRLTAADYDELDDGAPFVRQAGGRDVVLWRDRDDIYVAVTDLPPDALTDAFAMAR